MSLFKARDWWATYAGSDEEFDLGCLCVANIDNNGVQFGKVASSLVFVQSYSAVTHFYVGIHVMTRVFVGASARLTIRMIHSLPSV